MTLQKASGPTTVGEWFAALEPPPPAALAEELRRLLQRDASRPLAEVPEVCLETGERMLAELMRTGATKRGSALTLLAVDSLVTYAFEAASTDPTRIDELAANAMKRMSELAEQSNT